MGDGRDPEGVLLTGAYGTGKSTMLAELAYLMEDQPYAAIDLDWLSWFGGADHGEAAHRMLLTNLGSVVENYRAVGVRYFLMARALRTADEVDGLRRTLGMPMRVVRLTLPIEEIERRLGADVTTERREELLEAAAWVEGGVGAGFEDRTFANDGPIAGTAEEILAWLGWPRGQRSPS
ncbi:MAG TPA: hypothetical protein VK646_02885 [Actinomycetota bacterium]|nr:hypothetical protein [Actinomycetota bacterium]